MTIRTPEWVKHAVFYQIFPDRFARSQPAAQLDDPEMSVPLEPWDTPPTLDRLYKGGRSLGHHRQTSTIWSRSGGDGNAIYLTPIFQSALATTVTIPTTITGWIRYWGAMKHLPSF
jgi:cyclomaltodextrinase